jgi:NhaC family Na+:H+ antiporter
MGSANHTRKLSLAMALAPVATLITFLTLGALTTDIGRELLVVVLLASAAVAAAVAARAGCSWDDVQRATGRKLADVLPALLILLGIGMLIGTWVFSGTIPALVAVGLDLVHPRYLALTAFLGTAVMSTTTGTSWGSAGTLGVALVGMAGAMGASLPMVAGAVVSGAYLGDKMSPLSDTTNICAIGAGADLYAHIRHLLYTAIPSCVVAVAFYALAPSSGSAVSEVTRSLQGELSTVFDSTLWVWLPPMVVVVGVARRIPPVVALALSSVVAVGVGVAGQGFRVADGIRAMVSGFDLSMVAVRGVDPESLQSGFRTLVQRGGLDSMVPTLLMVIAAFLLAGAMEASGALELIIRRLLAGVRSTFGLIAATMTAGATTVGLTSHAGVTALVIGSLFRDAYADRGLAPVNLSRSLEDSVTLTEPLMPWTVSAVFMATTLGVSTVDYLPWAIFCLTGPLFSLILAATFDRTGFGLSVAKEGEKRTPAFLE